MQQGPVVKTTATEKQAQELLRQLLEETCCPGTPALVSRGSKRSRRRRLQLEVVCSVTVKSYVASTESHGREPNTTGRSNSQ